jgi:hypothetical protein
MRDEDEKLLDQARRSREEIEKARKEEEAAIEDEPWAKPTSGDADDDE